MRHLVMLVLIPCLVIVGCATEDGGSTTTDPNTPPPPPPPPGPFTMEGHWDASLSIAMSQISGPDVGRANITCTSGVSSEHVTYDANEMISGWNITLPNCGSIAALLNIQGEPRVAGRVHLLLTSVTALMEFVGQLQSNEAASSVSLFLQREDGFVRFEPPGPTRRTYQVTDATLTLLRLEL